MQKQQNSLIAGLRATNEPIIRPTLPEDKTPTGLGDKSAIATISGTVAAATCPPTSDAFSPTFSSTENEEKDVSTSAMAPTPGSGAAETATVQATQRAITATKRGYALNRSDSTGSSAGRKFLAPTSSDPQQRSTLSDKERLHIANQQKKKNSMTTSTLPVAVAAAISGPGHKKNSFFAADISQFHYPALNHFEQGHIPALGSPSGLMPHIIPGTKLLPFNNQANAVYEVHDWWQEQVLCQNSDDEM